MSSRSVGVRKDREMARMYSRSGMLHIEYVVDGDRKRKSTKLEDTKENRKLVEKTIIPQLARMIITGDIHKKADTTFGKYYSQFLTTKLNIRSFSTKKYQWDKVNLEFGKRDIRTITRHEIKTFLQNLNFKSSSKGAYKTAIYEVMEMALDDRIILNNPCVGVTLPHEKKNDIDYFTKDEVKVLLDNADGILKPYLIIALNTGMRPEEILGLQLGDIQRGKISIKRVRTKGRVDYPKTAGSTRTIPCPQFVIDEMVKIQGDNIFLFGDIDDIFKLHAQWHKLLDKCEFKRRRLYLCRHSFATIMMQDKIVSINELAGLLGHSTPKTTLYHYASIIDAKTIDLGKNFDLFGTFLAHDKNKQSESS